MKQTKPNQPTYREVVRALVEHIIVLYLTSYHLDLAVGALNPREVTELGRAR